MTSTSPPAPGNPPTRGKPVNPGTATAAVLLVEDDALIGRTLDAGLTAHGYHTRWARTGHSALQHTRHEAPDVVLLDLGLPDLDGIDLARQLRAEHPTLLIIILTARADDIDVVIGLDAGADDYLTKPFSLTVLLARLRAHLRTKPTLAAADSPPLEIGPLSIDPTTRRCHLHGREITLRPKEFDLLTALASAPGTALTRHELMTQVWDENWYGSTKTLDVTMAALRRTLTAADPDQPSPVITTLRGHGYRLEPQPPPP